MPDTGRKHMAGRIPTLLAFVAVTFLAPAFASLFPPGEWYASLYKPVFNPPSSVFAPVWAVLYLMMAMAAWRVWQRVATLRHRALVVWAIQLVLNAAWSWLFFGLHRPGWALGEMLLLIIAVCVTIWQFRAVDRVAPVLLLPYLVWLLFAWLLNLSIWRLSGGGFGTLLGSG
jgi:benzodiazapine receptor